MLNKFHLKAIILASILLLKASTAPAQLTESSKKNSSKIWIQIKLPDETKSNSYDLGYEDVDFVNSPNFIRLKPKIIDQVASLQIETSKPVLVDLSDYLGSEFKYTLSEPGDSILINVHDKIQITGAGSSKHRVLLSLKDRLNQVKIPENPKVTSILSLKDHQDWVEYVSAKERVVDSIFTLGSNGLSTFANNYLKAKNIAELEYLKLLRFGSVSGNPKKFNLTGNQLSLIFDNTFGNSQNKWLLSYAGETYYFYNYYEFVRQYTLRKANFDLHDESVTGINRTRNYYDQAKILLKGSALKNCLTYLITEKGIKEHTFKNGYLQAFEDLLARYYFDIVDQRHIKFTQKFDQEIHHWLTGVGMKGFNFSLPNTHGKLIFRDNFKDKVIILNFWKSKCKGCDITTRALVNVQKQFINNANVAFINISTDIDKDQWLSSLKKLGIENFGVNLYTNGSGLNHPVVQAYDVHTYPTLFLYDGNGVSLVNPNNPLYSDSKLLSTKFPDPTIDTGKALIERIKREIPILNDGPYVFHKQDSLIVYNLAAGIKSSVGYSSIQKIRLNAQTDDYEKTFSITLSKNHELEKATHAKTEKLIALSDIEGNFDVFRKLLQTNGVIDAKYNWVFGKGHLVFAGDMFDRGQQVTECLWLIYSLEEKAKLAGGYVHFVLGNHEIMNLQGNHEYARPKYERTAKLIGKSLTQLYGEDSELGRWLRTKNVVEKIGDLLFAHGGISPELRKSGIEISEMNRLARQNYSVSKDDYKDAKANLVMSSTFGPFWYRGYYPDKKDDGVESLVDSVLNTYKVKHIVTGHTIIADTISRLYNNKVINTDTRHARGKSEALLIEGRSYYRVNDKGKRWLLFKDEENDINNNEQK